MRQVIVTVFGFIPALCLCMLLMGALVGALDNYLRTSDHGILLTVFWCVSGLIGTIALFFSIEGKAGPATMLGLGLGIAATLATEMLLVASGIWKLFIAAPMAVAIFLIIEGFIAISNKSQPSENR